MNENLVADVLEIVRTGDQPVPVTTVHIADALTITPGKARRVLAYLKGRGLVESKKWHRNISVWRPTHMCRAAEQNGGEYVVDVVSGGQWARVACADLEAAKEYAKGVGFKYMMTVTAIYEL